MGAGKPLAAEQSMHGHGCGGRRGCFGVDRNAATQDINVLMSNELFGERITLFDLKLAKNIRFKNRRVTVGADIFNLFNSDAITGYNNDYILPENLAAGEENPWGTPTGPGEPPVRPVFAAVELLKAKDAAEAIRLRPRDFRIARAHAFRSLRSLVTASPRAASMRPLVQMPQVSASVVGFTPESRSWSSESVRQRIPRSSRSNLSHNPVPVPEIISRRFPGEEVLRDASGGRTRLVNGEAFYGKLES